VKPVGEIRGGDESARLAAIVESSDDAIISKDLNGIVQSWNEGAERLFGYSAKEMIGRSILHLIPPDQHDEETLILARVRRGERIEHYQTTRLAKSGRLLQVSLSVSPIRDHSGHVLGASKIVRDLTSRKRLEEELGQERARLKAILDTAVDAIISIDGRGIIQTVNPATERMFGYTRAELLGQNIKILMPPPFRDEHDGYMHRYKHTGERRIIGIGREVQARRKDGTVFAIDLAVSEVEPGKLFTGIVRDISERKDAELKLRQADRMASIGTLAAGLGHDMNNVLLPVRARLNALTASAQDGKMPPTERQHVEQIRKSVAYLQQLADGLHFLAMDPDTGEDARGGGASTDLAQWWMQAGPLLSKAVPKHVRVTASIPENLPRAAVPAHGLTQAMLNLVVNAGEAIPGPAERKRRQGYVRLWAQPLDDATGQWIRLGVTDNGSGMSEDVKRRAFDMFFTTKPRGLGTGLGLALVRKVAERAGGKVEIESQIGKGTSVVLIVPTASSKAETAAVNAPSAYLAISDGRARTLIKHLLEMSGVLVRTDGNANCADICIVDPSEADIADMRAWRKQSPKAQLVLFGAPEARMELVWDALQPIVISDPQNFEMIQSALSRAIIRE
jgi:PAS domain S-box-containing protein